MIRRSGTILAVVSLWASLYVGVANAQSSTVPADILDKSTQATFREFIDLLKIPNDSAVAQDIQKNVDWLEAAFKRRGFTTRQLPNNGKPMLFAEYPKKNLNSRTVLFYMHLDGQPVVESQWSQKSPWIPTLRQRTASGKWEEIDIDRLYGLNPNRDWRVFARSSSDDKGPIMMFLAAMDALRAAGMEPELNIKVILDSEEERGSPSISSVAKANRDLLRADAIVVNDGPKHATDKPTLIFGNRGNSSVRVIVFGAKENLHSGHYGNYAPNPAMRLAALLTSMKDESGRVTIPGYYERIRLTDAERKVLAEVPDDADAIKRRLGIAKAEAVGGNYQEAMQYPSLNILRLNTVAVGGVIPSRAGADLDLRTTPEMGPDDLYKLFEQHIVKQGYHLVKGEPTDAERAQHDKIASITRLGTGGSKAAYTPIDSALGNWARGALNRTFESPPVIIRMMGGTVPTERMVEALNMPFVIIPLVNADNNQHSYDENLRLGHYYDGVKTFVGLMRSAY